MSIEVNMLDDASEAHWDAFVSAHDKATFFHRAGWRRVLQQAFGHRCYFLQAWESGKLVGILPLAQVKSLLFGNSLSSLPFCVYGGIVANHPEAAEALRARACKLAQELQVDALEFRNQEADGADWPTKDLYYTFIKDIDPDDEVNLKAIPNRQRAMIRKGAAEGLASEWDAGCERIYRVYSESVRNLGTPVFTARYFRILREEFGSDCSVLMITQGDEDVCGVLNFYHKGTVLPYYGGSIARARTIRGSNDFMYWELMRRSREQGCNRFDFGRSKKDTGPFKFKKNWGFNPQPMPYAYHLVKAPKIPDLNPTNPKYRMMVEAWSRLPLPVANMLGPWLARSLG